MLLRGKKSPGKTVLLLDVENSSVGSALVRITQDKQPKLFGEMRSPAPLNARVTGARLAADIERAAAEAIRHASEVAARLRLHPKTTSLGAVGSVAVFLAPPWGKPNLDQSKPDFMPGMSRYLRGELEAVFEDVPVLFYTSAGATAFGVRSLFVPEPCLVCTITGEVSELMRMDNDGVRAHATIPTGFNALLRTLRAHGGLSEHEARSAARLPFGTRRTREPFRAAAEEFIGHFKNAVKELLSPGDILRVRVVGAEPAGEWFARALASNESLSELFPEGGEVRALRPHHLTEHIEAHAEVPDLLLMLDALFVDSGV